MSILHRLQFSFVSWNIHFLSQDCLNYMRFEGVMVWSEDDMQIGSRIPTAKIIFLVVPEIIRIWSKLFYFHFKLINRFNSYTYFRSHLGVISQNKFRNWVQWRNIRVHSYLTLPIIFCSLVQVVQKFIYMRLSLKFYVEIWSQWMEF